MPADHDLAPAAPATGRPPREPAASGYLLLALDRRRARRDGPASLAALREPPASGGGDRILQAALAPDGTAFEGIGVFGRALVRGAEDAMRHARGQGRGNYLLARHAADGAVTIEIDPFGYFPLFVHHEGGLFGAASSGAALARALHRLGRPVARDLGVHAWFSVQGAGAGERTGHAGIALLPRGTVVRVSPSNAVTYHRAPATEPLYSDRPLGELIDEAAHEILGNVQALSEGAFEHRICDLTGGMDSRLVLSAILRAGAGDAFLYHTKGRHPDPDANVAAMIRARFGLRRAVNVTPPRAAPRPPLEALRASVGHVDGLLSTYFTAPEDRPESARHLWIGGGSGELLREFWPSGGAAPARARGWRPWRRPAPAPSPLHNKLRRIESRGHLLRPDRRAALVAEAARFGEEALAAGVRPEHVGNLFYLSTRARYHFGVWWARSARARFHPLYSPAGLRAAHAMDPRDKAANRLGFELMRRFCPALVALPFALKSWSPAVWPEAPPPVPRGARHLGDPHEASVSLHRAPQRRTARSDHARALIARGEKQRSVDLGLMLAAFGAARVDLDALEGPFDAPAVRAFLDRPHGAMTGRYDMDTAYRLMGAAVWANGIEIG